MRDELLRELERERMAHLERRRVVHHAGLFANRRGDLLAAVAGVHAPQSGRAVQHLAAVGGGVVHVLRGDEHARRALEGAVRGERHPQLFERRKRRRSGGGRGVECLGGHGTVPEVSAGAATRGDSTAR